MIRGVDFRMTSNDSGDDKPKTKKLSPKEEAAQKKSMDAIDELPLSIIPLKSRSLKSAKLIKNNQMETVLELHNDPITGSLQVKIDDSLSHTVGSFDDQIMIKNLSTMQSFDVYTLRATLQKIGVAVEEEGDISLSDEMKSSLSTLTRAFTMPLMKQIFGDEQVLEDGNDLSSLFKTKDIEAAKRNLMQLSQKTGIPLSKLPNFLESYSDIFLSVSYYRYMFRLIEDEIDRFFFWTQEIKAHRDTQQSRQTIAVCGKVERDIKYIISSIRERFRAFTNSFELFWRDLSPQGFTTLESEIQNNYESLGAILCGIHVKIRNWASQFPDNETGGPQQRVQYILRDIEPGLSDLKKMAERH